jgi:hypothetical protein
VPIDSQAYPGAPNIVIGTENDGPAHKQEKQLSEDALYLALTRFARLPARGSATPPSPTPPPPAPAPSPAPAPEPDPDPAPPGSVEPPPAAVATTSGVLLANQLLWPGDTVSSTEGGRHLAYQGDGNLVLYDQNWAPRWASNTPGTRAGVVAMQADGNLVIYDPDGIALWSTNTAGHPGAYLAVQNDGNAVIYDADGRPLWATGTF